MAFLDASHGYLDGQTVACQNCQKRVTVRLHSREVVVAVATELETTALRCTQCGFMTCYACATDSPEGSSIPVCPSCKAQGGPYFFLK
jgi:hypothetical protein